ncbi:hypothetical protein, partial [Bifidobacterium bifidum]
MKPRIGSIPIKRLTASQIQATFE